VNSLISFDITDDDSGVNFDSIEVKVNGTSVFKDGKSPNGNCRAVAAGHKKRDYTIVYQSYDMFDYEQKVTVTITAYDYAGNPLQTKTYYIITEMRSFGENIKVNSDLGNVDSSRPVTVCDGSGNTWVVWQAGPDGNRDIYISKLASGADNFDTAVKITNNANDQINPAIAIDGDGKLYVVWQDNRNGSWDIYLSTYDGTKWSGETMVNELEDPQTNPASNQENPAIVIDGQSPSQAYVVWEDDDGGNQDIHIAISGDDFTTPTIPKLITSDTSDQFGPAITIDSSDTVYVVWTDGRNISTNGSTDIYGAASNNSWTEVAVVNDSYNQTSPVIAAEESGTILHLLWVDDTTGDTDIYYETSDGLSDCPVAGNSIIDNSGFDQKEPAVFVTGSTGTDLKVYACWQDWRNVNTTNPDDTDLYFVEVGGSLGTNIFVGDGGTNSSQSEPAIGLCKLGFPYLVWTDGRNAQKDIYYAGSTFVEPIPVWTKDIQHLTGANWGDDYLGKLDSPGEINIKIPPAAFPFDCDIRISASRIKNTRRFRNRESVGQYEFGPSGIQFKVPINIAIAYAPSSAPAEVYWYDPENDILRQDGIKILAHIEKDTVHIVHFQTRHFTPFILLGSTSAAVVGGGGGGGGGCAISAHNDGNALEYLLPYLFYMAVLVVIKLKDSRNYKAKRHIPSHSEQLVTRSAVSRS
jgi:beta propeller repeat protein